MNESNSVNMNENEWFINNEGKDNYEINSIYACPNCGKVIPVLEIDNCPYCMFNFSEGGVIDTVTGENIDYGTINSSDEKVKNSELIQSIKDDFKNSKSIELVKNYFKDSSNRRAKKKEDKEKKKTEIKALEEQLRELKKQK